MSDVVLVENLDHVRIIRLNRPEKKNALDEELAWGLVGAVQEAAADDDVWVIGLTGSGDAFCAGLDLGDRGESATPLGPISNHLDDIHWVGRFLLGIRDQCDKPVVGGLNGVALPAPQPDASARARCARAFGFSGLEGFRSSGRRAFRKPRSSRRGAASAPRRGSSSGR